jgi:hypothetical protein
MNSLEALGQQTLTGFWQKIGSPYWGAGGWSRNKLQVKTPVKAVAILLASQWQEEVNQVREVVRRQLSGISQKQCWKDLESGWIGFIRDREEVMVAVRDCHSWWPVIGNQDKGEKQDSFEHFNSEC